MKTTHKEGKVFVIGDIHGNYKGLRQVLEQANFDYLNDELIILGDVVDGWGDDLECVETLLCYNHIAIKGNHDDKFIKHLKKGQVDKLHERTYESFTDCAEFGYLDSYQGLSHHIQNYFDNLVDYHIRVINEKRYLFVHGGFNRHFKLNEQPNNGNNIFLWDRDLYLQAVAYDSFTCNYPFKMREQFDHIFIGHTPTLFLNGRTTPIRLLNDLIINMDTGSGFNQGKISMMNIEDFDEVYQSDTSEQLYPNLKSIKK